MGNEWLAMGVDRLVKSGYWLAKSDGVNGYLLAMGFVK